MTGTVNGLDQPRPAVRTMRTTRTEEEYRAFISYSHAADGELAPALQRGLHRLAKPWYRLPAFRVFRDQTSLTASPGLWSSIEEALRRSRFFVLLASPTAAASPWVDREARWWLEHKPRNRMLIVLAEGTIAWNRAANDFDWRTCDALPPGLSGAFDEEPHWIDLRWARTTDDVSLRNALFRDAVADLAAPLHVMAKERLVGEDTRQQRRALGWRNAAIAALVVLTLIATLMSFQFFVQRNNALEQRNLATSRQLASESSLELERQPEVALLLGVASVRTAPPAGRQAAIDHLAALLDHSYHQSTTLTGHAAPVRDVVFAPDGGSLLTAAEDGNVRTWGLSSGQVRDVHRTGGDAAYAVAEDPDGTTFAAGGGGVRVWTNDGTELPTPDRLDQAIIYALAFSPDGTRVSAAGADGTIDGTISSWDVADGARQVDLPTQEGTVWALAYSPDGRTLVSAGEDQLIHFWDARTGKPEGAPLDGHEDGIWDLAYSPDGRSLTSASSDGTVRIWDSRSHRLVRQLRLGDTRVTAVGFSPAGDVLATGDNHGTIRLWNATTGESIGDPLHGHLGAVWSVDFSPDGATLASGSSDTTVRIWDVADTRPLGQPLTGHSVALGLAYSADGSTLASGGTDKGTSDATLRLWNVADHLQIGDVLRTPQGKIWSLAFAPGGTLLAAGGEDGTIQFWDAAGHRSDLLDAHSADVNGLAFSPDSLKLASAGEDGTIRLFDAFTRQPLGSPTRVCDATTALAFSPDGRRVAASCADSTIALWDVAQGSLVRDPVKVPGGGVNAIAFAPDGVTVYLAGIDGAIRVWDTQVDRAVGEPMTGHTGEVWTVALSGDGTTLASGGADGTVRLWDLASGTQRGEALGGFAAWVWKVAFRPDGKQLASADINGDVRLWDLDPAVWVASACALANRDLSEAEWERYVGADVPFQPTCP
jgi:WD40 repeat protein